MNDYPAQLTPALPVAPVADTGGWDIRSSIYRVTVHNEITGETAVIEWEADCKESAQFGVLHMQFRSHGWRKAVAMVPEADSEAA
jgi:hypothetical protein